MLFRAVVLSSFAALVMFRAFAGVETLDTFAPSHLPWFANTKEYQSLYVDSLPELTTDESNRTDPFIHQFFSKENEKNLKCESDILASLSEKIKQAGIALNRRTIRGVLRVARVKNLVDDVALTPLLWVLDAVDPVSQNVESEADYAYFDLGIFPYSELAAIPRSEEERKIDREFEKKCQTEEGKELEEQNHELLGKCQKFYYSRLNSQCSVTSFRSTQKLIRNEKGETLVKKVKIRAVLSKIDDLVKLGVISSARGAYYQRLYEARLQDKQVSWVDFESRVTFKKDSLVRKEHSDEIPKFLADRMKKSGLSRRVEFYSRFDTNQIEHLARLYVDFTDFIDADNRMDLNLVSRDTEVLKWKLELLFPSQYCVATMLLREFIAAKANSDIFKKSRITYEDVATAAIETGFVSAEQVKAVLKTDDVWNPKKSGFQRVIEAVARFGGPALVFVPPPFNMVSSLALTLVQSTKKKDDNECKSIGTKTIVSPYQVQNVDPSVSANEVVQDE